MESSSPPPTDLIPQLHPFFIYKIMAEEKGKKKKTTQEILFGSAFRLDVCYHLETKEKRWNSYFQKKKKKNSRA